MTEHFPGDLIFYGTDVWITLTPKGLRMGQYSEEEILNHCLRVGIDYTKPESKEFAPNYWIRTLHANRRGEPVRVSTEIGNIRATWSSDTDKVTCEQVRSLI